MFLEGRAWVSKGVTFFYLIVGIGGKGERVEMLSQFTRVLQSVYEVLNTTVRKESGKEIGTKRAVYKGRGKWLQMI